LDFLFYVTGGDGLGKTDNQKIFEDFFGPYGGQGGIVITTGSLSTSPTINGGNGYTGLNANFQNRASAGAMNTFVPEPAAYSLAASVFAILGFAGVSVITRRKQA